MGNKQGIPGHIGERTPRSPDTRARSWSFHGVSGARRKAATLPGHADTAGNSTSDESPRPNLVAADGEEGMRTRSSSMHERERPTRRGPLYSWDDNDPSLRTRVSRGGPRFGDEDTVTAHLQRLRDNVDFDEASTIQMRPHHHLHSPQTPRPSSENRSRRQANASGGPGERGLKEHVRRESAPARPQGWHHPDLAVTNAETEACHSPGPDSSVDPWRRISTSDRRGENVEEPSSRKELFKDSEGGASSSAWRKKQKKDQKGKSKKKASKGSNEGLPKQDIQVLDSSPKRRVSKGDTDGSSKPQQDAGPDSERSLMSSPRPAAASPSPGGSKLGRSLSPSKWLRSPKSPPQSPRSTGIVYHYPPLPEGPGDVHPERQQHQHSRVVRMDSSDLSPMIPRSPAAIKDNQDVYNDLNDLLTSPSNTRRKGKIIVSRSQGLGRSSGVSSPSPSSSRAPVTTGEVITLSTSVNAKAEVSSSSAVSSSAHRRVSSSSSSTSASPALLPASRSDSSINPLTSLGAGGVESPGNEHGTNSLASGGVVLLRRVGPTRRSGVSNIVTTRPGRPSSTHEPLGLSSPSSPLSPLTHSPLFLYMRKDPAPSSPSFSSSVHSDAGHQRRVLVSRSARSRHAPNRLSLDLSRLGSGSKDNCASKGSEGNLNSSVLSPGSPREGVGGDHGLPTLQETTGISHSTGHVAHYPSHLQQQNLLISTTSDQYLDSLGRRKKQRDGGDEKKRTQLTSSETQVGVGRHEASVTVVDVGPTTTFTPTQPPRKSRSSVEDDDGDRPPIPSTASALPASHVSSVSAISMDKPPALLPQEAPIPAQHSAHETTPLLRNFVHEMKLPHQESAQSPSRTSGPVPTPPPLVSPNFAATITTTDSGYNTGKRCASVDLYGSIRPGTAAAVPSPPAGLSSGLMSGPGSGEVASTKTVSGQQQLQGELMVDSPPTAVASGAFKNAKAAGFADIDAGEEGVAKQALLSLSDTAGLSGQPLGHERDSCNVSVWSKTSPHCSGRDMPGLCPPDSCGLARQTGAGNFTDRSVSGVIHHGGIPSHPEDRDPSQRPDLENETASCRSEKISYMDKLSSDDSSRTAILSNHSSYDNLTSGRDRQMAGVQTNVLSGWKDKGRVFSGNKISGVNDLYDGKGFVKGSVMNTTQTRIGDGMLTFSEPHLARKDGVRVDPSILGQDQDGCNLPVDRLVDGDKPSYLLSASGGVSLLGRNESNRGGMECESKGRDEEEEENGRKGEGSVGTGSTRGDGGMSPGERDGGQRGGGGGREIDVIVKGVGHVTEGLPILHDGHCGQDTRRPDSRLGETNARPYDSGVRVARSGCEQGDVGAAQHGDSGGDSHKIRPKISKKAAGVDTEADFVSPGPTTFETDIEPVAGSGGQSTVNTETHDCETREVNLDMSLDKECERERTEPVNSDSARDRGKQYTTRPGPECTQQGKAPNLYRRQGEENLDPLADKGPKTVGSGGVRGDACELGAAARSGSRSQPVSVRHATAAQDVFLDRDSTADRLGPDTWAAEAVVFPHGNKSCQSLPLPESFSDNTGTSETVYSGVCPSVSSSIPGVSAVSEQNDYVRCGRVEQQQQQQQQQNHRFRKNDFVSVDKSGKFPTSNMLASGLKGGSREPSSCRADEVGDYLSPLADPASCVASKSCESSNVDIGEREYQERYGFKSSEEDSRGKPPLSSSVISSSSPSSSSISSTTTTPQRHTAIHTLDESASPELISNTDKARSTVKSKTALTPSSNRDFSCAQTKQLSTGSAAGETSELFGNDRGSGPLTRQEQQSSQSNNGRNVDGMHASWGESQIRSDPLSSPSPSPSNNAVQSLEQAVGVRAVQTRPSGESDRLKPDSQGVLGERQPTSYSSHNHALSEIPTRADVSKSEALSSSSAIPPVSSSPLSVFSSPSTPEKKKLQGRKGERGGSPSPALASSGANSSGSRVSYVSGRPGDRHSSSDSGGGDGVGVCSPSPRPRYVSQASGEDSGYYGDGPAGAVNNTGSHSTKNTSIRDSRSGKVISPQLARKADVYLNQGGRDGDENKRAINAGRSETFFKHSRKRLEYLPEVRDGEEISYGVSVRDGNIPKGSRGAVLSGEDVDKVHSETSAKLRSSHKASFDVDKSGVTDSIPEDVWVSRPDIATGSTSKEVGATESSHIISSSTGGCSAVPALTTVNTTASSTSGSSNSSGSAGGRPRILEVTNPSYETDSLDKRDSASKLREVAKKLLAGHAALSGRLTSTLSRQNKKEQTPSQQQQQQHKKKRQKNQNQQQPQQTGKKHSLTLFTPLGKFGRKKASAGSSGNSSNLASNTSAGPGKGLSRELSGSEGSLGDLSRRRGAASQYRDLSLSENSVLDAVNDDDDDEDEWFFFPGSTKDRKGTSGGRRGFPFEPSDDFAANVKSIYSQGQKSIYTGAAEGSLSKSDLSYPLDVARSYAAGGFQDPGSPELTPISPNTGTKVIDYGGPSQVRRDGLGTDVMSQSYSAGNSTNHNSGGTSIAHNLRDGDDLEGKDDDIDFALVEMRPRTNSATAIELGSRTPGRIAMGMASARIRRSYASPVKEHYPQPARPASHSLVSPVVGVRSPATKTGHRPRNEDSLTGVSQSALHSPVASTAQQSPSIAQRQILQQASPGQPYRQLSSTDSRIEIAPGDTGAGTDLDHLHRQHPDVTAPRACSSPGQKLLVSRALRSDSPAGYNRPDGHEKITGRSRASTSPSRLDAQLEPYQSRPARASPCQSPRRETASPREMVWEPRPEFQRSHSSDAGPRSLDESLLTGAAVSSGIDVLDSGRDRANSRDADQLLSTISPLSADMSSVSPTEDLELSRPHSRGSREWNVPRQRHSLDSGQRYLSQSAEFSSYQHNQRRPTYHGSALLYSDQRGVYPHHYDSRQFPHPVDQHFRGYDPRQLFSTEQQFEDINRISPRSGMDRGFPEPHLYPSHVMGENSSAIGAYPTPDGAPHRLMSSPHLHALSPMSRASISLAPLPEEHNLNSVHGDSLSDLRYGSSGSLALSTSLPAEGGGGFPPPRRYKVVPNYPADTGRSYNVWAGERWTPHGPTQSSTSMFYPASSSVHFPPSASSHLRHQRSSSIHSIPTLESRYQQQQQPVYSYDDSSVSHAAYQPHPHYDNLQLHPSEFGPVGGPQLDIRSRSHSLVTSPGSEIAARLGGFSSGRCLNPSDRAWSYSVTSLVESGSTSGLLLNGEFSRQNLQK